MSTGNAPNRDRMSPTNEGNVKLHVITGQTRIVRESSERRDARKDRVGLRTLKSTSQNLDLILATTRT